MSVSAKHVSNYGSYREVNMIVFIKMMLTVFSVIAMSFSISAQTSVTFTDDVPATKGLVLGVFEGGKLGALGRQLDEDADGGLSHAISASEFSGGSMTTLRVPAPKGMDARQILLVGLGPEDGGLDELTYQNIGGNAAQEAVASFGENFAFVMDLQGRVLADLGFGAKLGSYYFDKYYTDAERQKRLDELTIVTTDDESAEAIFRAELDPVANAVWYARDISNEPANVIYPQSFVERWTAHFNGLDDVSISVIDEAEMLERGMGAIYGVGQGSRRPPRMMIVEYMGGKKGDNPVVIAGKGITFDTGGISLKNPPNMWNMKFDMSGAASALGTIHALAARGAKVNAVGIAALAENMPGANAQRPGDVVKSLSGKTIQIRSTDAEGRLVLADGLYYGDMTYDPAVLINLATLTGSARRALGSDYGALFSRHDDLAGTLLALGEKTGDPLWRLPLNENHFKAIENNVADVMNSGPTAPGASAGAAFLGTFVRETTPWAHMDIAGIAYSDKASPTKASPGSVGFGIRLLNAFVKEHHEAN